MLGRPKASKGGLTHPGPSGSGDSRCRAPSQGCTTRRISKACRRSPLPRSPPSSADPYRAVRIRPRGGVHRRRCHGDGDRLVAAESVATYPVNKHGCRALLRWTTDAHGEHPEGHCHSLHGETTIHARTIATSPCTQRNPHRQRLAAGPRRQRAAGHQPDIRRPAVLVTVRQIVRSSTDASTPPRLTNLRMSQGVRNDQPGRRLLPRTRSAAERPQQFARPPTSTAPEARERRLMTDPTVQCGPYLREHGRGAWRAEVASSCR